MPAYNPSTTRAATASPVTTSSTPPNPLPHLTQIINRVGSSEDYLFTYTADTDAAIALRPVRQFRNHPPAHPHDPLALLVAPTSPTPPTTPANSSKPSSPTAAPSSGTSSDFTYTGTITFREIQWRQLKTTSTGAVFSGHWFQHDYAGDASRSCHSWGRVDDTSGSNSGKIWYFLATAGGNLGLVNQYKQYQVSPYSELLIRNYTWATSASGNPYIDSVTTTQDGITSKTTQTIDAYGNLTEQRLYGFTDLTTVKRTQTMTYLAPYGYRTNRLLTASVDGVQMVSNTYDQYSSLQAADGITLHDPAYNNVLHRSRQRHVDYVQRHHAEHGVQHRRRRHSHLEQCRPNHHHPGHLQKLHGPLRDQPPAA